MGSSCSSAWTVAAAGSASSSRGSSASSPFTPFTPLASCRLSHRHRTHLLAHRLLRRGQLRLSCELAVLRSAPDLALDPSQLELQDAAFAACARPWGAAPAPRRRRSVTSAASRGSSCGRAASGSSKSLTRWSRARRSELRGELLVGRRAQVAVAELAAREAPGQELALRSASDSSAGERLRRRVRSRRGSAGVVPARSPRERRAGPRLRGRAHRV